LTGLVSAGISHRRKMGIRPTYTQRYQGTSKWEEKKNICFK
jgi:hypothetical protein